MAENTVTISVEEYADLHAGQKFIQHVPLLQMSTKETLS